MKTCCFIGHRKINANENLLFEVRQKIESLIKSGVCTFLFGSRSEFDKLCLEVVTELKEKHPHLVRVYVRAEYEYINRNYEDYLLKSYDKTYFSSKAQKACALSYVLRNNEMIDNSDICVFYYDKNIIQKSSGTKLAFEYAIKKSKTIINICDI